MTPTLAQQQQQQHQPPSTSTPSSKGVSAFSGSERGGGGVANGSGGHHSASSGMQSTHFISIDQAIERIGMGRFQYTILVAAGLCFAADAMEILLLSFLNVVLKQEWDLSPGQAASITSSVFAGQVVGTLVLGPLGDVYGRRPLYLASAVIISIFGLATALAFDFWTLVITRALVGFGVGGVTIPFDILAELVPTSHRGKNLLFIDYFWTGGTLLVPLLAYLSLGDTSYDIDEDDGNDKGSWRTFVVLCALPCLVSAIMGCCVVPESPRWLLTKGRSEEALSVLRLAAKKNGSDPDIIFQSSEGTGGDYVQLRNDEEEPESSDFSDLFKPKWRWITIPLWGSWAGFAFLYYGTILTVTDVFSENDAGGGGGEGGGVMDGDGGYRFDYGAIFTSCSAEVFGTTLAIFAVDTIGRIRSQLTSYLLGAISVGALCFLAGNTASDDVDDSRTMRFILILLAFCARLFMMSGTCTTWVSTAEILTTEIRTTGHSAANAVARVGAFLSPYVVEESTALWKIGIVMMIVSLFTASCISQLPETKGMEMGTAVPDPPGSRPTRNTTAAETQRNETRPVV